MKKMDSVITPPDDITPEEYYLTWLPKQADANPDAANKLKGIKTTIQFVITGEDGGEFYLALDDCKITTHKGTTESPELTVKQSVDVWREINSGKRNPKMAFMSGKLKVSGSLAKAMKLGKMFFPL